MAKIKNPIKVTKIKPPPISMQPILLSLWIRHKADIDKICEDEEFPKGCKLSGEMLENWYNNGPLGEITKDHIKRALEAARISADVLVSQIARIAMADMGEIVAKLEASEILTDRTGTKNMMHPNKMLAIDKRLWPAIKEIKKSRGGRYMIKMEDKMQYFRLLAEMKGLIGQGGQATTQGAGPGSTPPKLTIEIINKK